MVNVGTVSLQELINNFLIGRIMQMTLIHDLAECIVGDITPFCGIPPDVKHQMEDKAMEDICKLLGDKGPEILQIFRVKASLMPP